MTGLLCKLSLSDGVRRFFRTNELLRRGWGESGFDGLFGIRFQSAESVKTEKLGPQLELVTSTNENSTTSSRPMVVLYSWLLAKSRPLSKFYEFYNKRGYDVLNVKTSPSDVVWPKNAHAVVQDQLEFLSDGPQRHRPLLVHGFSIGGYLFGETLNRSGVDSGYHHVRSRIRGLILDSPVDFDNVPAGVSRTYFKTSVPLQLFAKGLVHSYIIATYPFTGRHYRSSSKILHANPIRHAPTLWLYSTADSITPVKDVHACIREWEALGIECQQKCWSNSPHIMHFHYNQEEYVAVLNAFLDSLEKSSDRSQFEIL